MGEVEGKGERMYRRPKDSNAGVGVCGHAIQKPPEQYDR